MLVYCHHPRSFLYQMCHNARAVCQLVLVNVTRKRRTSRVNTASGDDREMNVSAIAYE